MLNNNEYQYQITENSMNNEQQSGPFFSFNTVSSSTGQSSPCRIRLSTAVTITSMSVVSRTLYDDATSQLVHDPSFIHQGRNSTTICYKTLLSAFVRYCSEKQLTKRKFKRDKLPPTAVVSQN
ncbi:hypothetical protein T4D_3551 [Trichinella pseudospiralis]|uniref:Uncharacterized protein n=1 Tax=Trichinella pseudospiralis TaxID=6337 RepID=A0A0V1FLI9_TRIPS|nr:hypothetical protein T4D_3551 [Trichinella pseudospiralis]